MRRAVADLAHATAFLTRLPVPARLFGAVPLDFGRQCWAFPVVAAFVGALAAAVGATLGANPALAALAVVAVGTVLTGALHEDGLADCVDGFWGAHGRERRLAIMRDSRIGTYGVLALVLVTIARIAAIAPLAGDAVLMLAALAAAGAFGRAALVWHWVALPAARSAVDAGRESLATRFGRPVRTQAFAATAVALAILAGCAFATGPVIAVAALAASLAAAGATWLAWAKIGGFSGDTLGATALAAETAFLCALSLLTSAP